MPASVIDTAPLTGSTDLSVHSLDGIFGTNWFSMDPQVSGSASIIVDMLQLLNEFSMFGLTLLFAATFATAVVGTAHEGRPLGQKLHSFWVPVRFSLATGMLVPMPSGLCLFQLVILAIVGWSISGANQLWEVFINSSVKSELITVEPNDEPNIPGGIYKEAQKVAGDALSNLVAIQYKVVTYPNLVQAGTPVYETKIRKFSRSFSILGMPDTINGATLQFQDVTTLVDNHSKMGSIEITCNTENMCTEIQNSVAELVNTLQPVAVEIAKRGTMKSDSMPDKAVFDQAVTKLGNDLVALKRKYYKEELTRLAGDVDTFVKGAAEIGWLGAGSYYHTILALQTKAQEAAKGTLSSTPPNYAALDDGLRQFQNTLQVNASYEEYGD